jgi:tetratricopeptide (TPR) repeat protein
MDILSLASLLYQISDIIDNPHPGMVNNGIDLIALGRIYEEMGEFDAAAECFRRGLEFELPSNIRRQGVQRWSFMEKRRENLDLSIQLWQSAVEYEEIYAYVELAKVYEHKLRDYPQAIYWTEQAIMVIHTQQVSSLDRSIWNSQLDHRLSRLNRKFSRSEDSQ